MEQLILVRFGEIHLKGLNRPYFEHRLVREMKRRLYDEPQAAVEKVDGRYYIDVYKRQDTSSPLTQSLLPGSSCRSSSTAGEVVETLSPSGEISTSSVGSTLSPSGVSV